MFRSDTSGVPSIPAIGNVQEQIVPKIIVESNEDTNSSSFTETMEDDVSYFVQNFFFFTLHVIEYLFRFLALFGFGEIFTFNLATHT